LKATSFFYEAGRPASSFAEAKIDQLVVLIDDLDRRLPDPAIETLESVRLFAFTFRTAFVVDARKLFLSTNH